MNTYIPEDAHKDPLELKPIHHTTSAPATLTTVTAASVVQPRSSSAAPSSTRKHRRQRPGIDPHPADAVLLSYLAPNLPDIAACARLDGDSYSSATASSDERDMVNDPQSTSTNMTQMSDPWSNPTNGRRYPSREGSSTPKIHGSTMPPRPEHAANPASVVQTPSHNYANGTLPPMTHLFEVADKGRSRTDSYSTASSASTNFTNFSNYSMDYKQAQPVVHSPPSSYARSATVGSSPGASLSYDAGRTTYGQPSQSQHQHQRHQPPPAPPAQPPLPPSSTNSQSQSQSQVLQQQLPPPPPSQPLQPPSIPPIPIASDQTSPQSNSSITEGYPSPNNGNPSDYSSGPDGSRSMTIPSPQTLLAITSGGGYRCQHPGCTAAPFQTQYLLNSHANVHSDERPHFCPHEGCPHAKGGRGFKRKNEMKRHLLVHNSPGYTCPFCPDRNHKYPRPDNLQRHVRAHHEGVRADDPQLREVLESRRAYHSRSDSGGAGSGRGRKKKSSS